MSTRFKKKARDCHGRWPGCGRSLCVCVCVCVYRRHYRVVLLLLKTYRLTLLVRGVIVVEEKKRKETNVLVFGILYGLNNNRTNDVQRIIPFCLFILDCCDMLSF